MISKELLSEVLGIEIISIDEQKYDYKIDFTTAEMTYDRYGTINIHELTHMVEKHFISIGYYIEIKINKSDYGISISKDEFYDYEIFDSILEGYDCFYNRWILENR